MTVEACDTDVVARLRHRFKARAQAYGLTFSDAFIDLYVEKMAQEMAALIAKGSHSERASEVAANRLGAEYSADWCETYAYQTIESFLTSCSQRGWPKPIARRREVDRSMNGFAVWKTALAGVTKVVGWLVGLPMRLIRLVDRRL